MLQLRVIRMKPVVMVMEVLHSILQMTQPKPILSLVLMVAQPILIVQQTIVVH